MQKMSTVIAALAGMRSTLASKVHLNERRIGAIALVVAVSVVGAARSEAQGYPFSQRGSVSQNVAHTEITITYGRPVARGRVLFGQLVPWDSVWHPGADSATRVSVSRDILLEGQQLRAGEYSLWLIPREKAAWTLILSRAAHAFHKPYPGKDADALRLEITPETGAHMESLAVYFPQVLREEALLRIHWGTTMLPVRITAPFRPE